MALEYGFYNSLNGDRRYNSAQMGELFEGLITDGVYPSVGEKFAVTPGEGRQILVGTGRAWFNATWSKNRAKYPMDLDIPDPVFDRIDSVCIKVDKTSGARANSFVILKGLVATTAQPPTLPTDNPEITYHPLAYVRIRAASESITAGDITILVGTSACPYTTSILQQTNIDELFAQWTDQFMTWWNGLKTILDGDAVGNIMNALSEKLDVSAKATPAEVNEGIRDDKYVTPYSVKQYVEGARYEIGDIVCKYGPMEDEDFVRCDGTALSKSSYQDFYNYAMKHHIVDYIAGSGTGIISNAVSGGTVDSASRAYDVISDGAGNQFLLSCMLNASYSSVGYQTGSTDSVMPISSNGDASSSGYTGFPFSVNENSYTFVKPNVNVATTMYVNYKGSAVATAPNSCHFYRWIGIFYTSNGADIVFLGHPSTNAGTSALTNGQFYIARFRVSGSAYSLTIVAITDTYSTNIKALVVGSKLFIYGLAGYYELATADVPTKTTITSTNTWYSTYSAVSSFLGYSAINSSTYGNFIKASPNLKHFVTISNATTIKCLNLDEGGKASYRTISCATESTLYGTLLSVSIDDDGTIYAVFELVYYDTVAVPGVHVEETASSATYRYSYGGIFREYIYDPSAKVHMITFNTNGVKENVLRLSDIVYKPSNSLNFIRPTNSLTAAIGSYYGNSTPSVGYRTSLYRYAGFYISGLYGSTCIGFSVPYGKPAHSGIIGQSSLNSGGTLRWVSISESSSIAYYGTYNYTYLRHSEKISNSSATSVSVPKIELDAPMNYDFWIKVKDSKNLGIDGATPML